MQGRPPHPPRRAESGATGLSLAVAAIMLFSFAALAVDLGLAFVNKRNLQAVTDVAAIAATYGLDTQGHAQTLATSALTDANNTRFFGSATLTGVTLGNATVTNSEWTFTAGGNPRNAVQVQTTSPSPIYFARVFLPSSTGAMTLPASATAMRQDLASFCAGTGLLNVNSNNSALLNALLGGALRTSVNLSAASYQGLADTQINALSFLEHLATNIGLTAGTYNQVLTSNVTMGQILQAQIDALNAPGSIATLALNQLLLSASGSPSIQLGQLFKVGVWQSQQRGGMTQAMAAAAKLDLLSLVTGAAEIANGNHAVAVPGLAVNISGVASIAVKMTIGEKMQCALLVPPCSVDPTHCSLHTSQVRLLLTINLLGVSGTSASGSCGALSVVCVPLYLEVADGTVTLDSIDNACGAGANPKVTLGVTTGLVKGWIGDIDDDEMNNFSHEPFDGAAPPPATLVNVSLLLSLVTIQGQAAITPIASTSAQAAFTAAQIGATPPYTQTIGTQVTHFQLGPLTLSTGGLVGGLLNPLLQPILNLLRGTVPAIINATGLLNLVNDLLHALGISVGNTTVSVTGVRCAVPSLVR